MAKLYELVGSYRQVMAAADTDSGEEFLAVLETLSDAIDTKMESCAKVAQHLKADMEMVKTEADRLAVRRKSIEANLKRLKGYMRESMEASRKQKIKTPLFTVYITAGKPKVEIENEETISSEYRADPTPPPLDKKAILVALQAGKEVAGASLGIGDPSLNIR